MLPAVKIQCIKTYRITKDFSYVIFCYEITRQWNSHFSQGKPVTKFQSHWQKILNGSTVSFENITQLVPYHGEPSTKLTSWRTEKTEQ